MEQRGIKKAGKYHWVLVGFLLAGWCGLAQAGTFSPVGYWQTIDDHSGKPKSIVQIEDVNGILHGKVVKTLVLPGAPKPLENCEKCSGARKNKPIVGMTVLWGLSSHQTPNVWAGGQVLDPRTGEIYSCKVTLLPDGQTLEVRGYLGISLLGRTQTWHRVNKP